MIHVLFVCLGNICRSPLAEAIFNDKVEKAGLRELVSSDSAGTGAYHIGSDPDHRSIEVANRYRIRIAHKARQLTNVDGDKFNYILSMDSANHRNIIHELGDQHPGLYLMRDFDPVEKGDVPDPYYGGEDGFELVYQMLDRSIDQFLEFIKKDNRLHV